MKARYAAMRELGLSRRAALVSLVPVRLRAVYILARGGTVIYRADIGGEAMVTITRRHALVAETTIIQMRVAARHPGTVG